MSEVLLRKKLTCVEEVFHEGGPPAAKSLRRAAVIAVIKNPYAGNYVAHIEAFMDDLKPLGLEMARTLIAALGGDPKIVEGYGKGAIVGSAGELEHSALWHAPGGYGMREVLGGAKAIVASTKKVGRPRHSPRRAHHPHQRLLRAQSFRLHGSRHQRRTPRRRDSASSGNDHRPPHPRPAPEA